MSIQEQKTILWIEDNPGEDRFLFITDYCDENNIKLLIFKTIAAFARWLKDNKDNENIKIIGVILDIMLMEKPMSLIEFDDETTNNKYEKITWQHPSHVGDILLKEILTNFEFNVFKGVKNEGVKIMMLTSLMDVYVQDKQNLITNEKYNKNLLTLTHKAKGYESKINNWMKQNAK
jgi:hypothetical protein